MNILRNEELKIFVTFFIFYSLFIHWVSWNENTRLLLAISIVEKNTFDISEYANFTGDRLVINGKYYSDKPPGISLFLSPIYFFSKTSFREQFGSNEYVLVPEPQFNTTVYYIRENLEKSVIVTMVFGVIFLSCLVGALSVVIFRRILLLFFSKKTSFILSIVFGLSTLVFPYSTVLMGNSFSLFLILLSFCIFQRDYKQKHLLGGILLGLALLIDYTSIVAIVILVLFVFSMTTITEKVKLLSSILLGITPLLIYSLSVFGTPIGFLSYNNFLDPSIYPCRYGNKYFELCPELTPLSLRYLQEVLYISSLIILHLLIFPYRGLLFYTPVVLFTLVGLLLVFKRDKQIFYLSFLTFLFSVLLNSSYPYWFGGSSFGAKYLVNSLPFITLPIGYLLEDKKFRKNKILLALFSLSVVISTFHMFLSTSAPWEGVIVVFGREEVYLYANWYENAFFASSFRELNPLYQHYLPAFLDNGPRSRILEHILAKEMPDIRDFREIPRTELKLLSVPSGFITISVTFLPIIFLTLVLATIWGRELSAFKIYGLSMKWMIIIALLFLVFSKIKVRHIYHGDGWLPAGKGEEIKWSSKSGEIYIFSPMEKEAFINLSISTYKSKTLDVYLNGNLIGSYISPERIVEPIRLKKGENKLLIYSREKCEIPLYVENQLKCASFIECMKFNISILNISFDARCLSFGIKDLSLLPVNFLSYRNLSIIYGSGFYSQEKNGTWISKNAKVYIYSDTDRVLFLNVSAESYSDKVRVVLNNKTVDEIILYSNFLPLEIKSGLNNLTIESNECFVPAKLSYNSDDYRCLSLFIVKMSFTDLHELKENIYFGKGWYEGEEKGRWMTSRSTIYLVKTRNYSKLSLEFESFKRARKLFVEINNKSYVFEIKEPGAQKISFVIEPKSLTKIKLDTYPPCEIAGENDDRCLSLFLMNFSLEDIKDVEYFDFFDEEKYGEMKFRWFSNNSRVYIFSNTTGLFLLNFSAWTPPNQKRVLKIYLDGIKMSEHNISETKVSIYLPIILKKGINELLFVSDGCGYVPNDVRCLGIAISEIQKDVINIENMGKIASGFYELEKAYGDYFRWMSDVGEIKIFSPSNISGVLYVKMGWSYFFDRTLNITLNDKLIFVDKITKSGREFSVKLNLVEGWNNLKFTSTCDVPSILEYSDDKRCLSLAFTDFNFLASNS